MVRADATLPKRLDAWAKGRDIEGGAGSLGNRELRDAARDLQVSFADIRAARDALVEAASSKTLDAGAAFSAELEVMRVTGTQHGRRVATRGPLGTRFAPDVERLHGVTPRHTEQIEGPLPALEKLVDDQTGASAWRRPWDKQSDAEHAALSALGFDEPSWTATRGGNIGAAPASMRTAFDKLSARQQDAAGALGHDAASWDAGVETRRDVLDNRDILKAFTSLLGRDGLISSDDVKGELLPQARDWGVETPSEKRALLYLLDFHGHRFTQEARRTIREDVVTHTLRDQVAGGFAKLDGGSGVIVNDASALQPTMVRQVVRATSPEDVRHAIGLAKALGASVSIAGRRHSEGGHTVAPASINIDMMGMNRMELLDNGNLRVEAGATWAQVQETLAKHGRAVKIMQSANIFTVGGSVAANVHGRTPGEPPLQSTIKSMRVMTADGEIVTCSRDENPELFNHVNGGYGLFGVVLDVELETRENTPCEMDVELVKEGEYLAKLAEAAQDPEVQLAWGRLAPSLNGEVLVHRVKSTSDDAAQAAEERDGVSIESGSAAAMTKAIFNLSKIGPFGLEARWALEKRARLGGDAPEATLSQFSSPNVELLDQYWFNEGKKTDLLHEYYVPAASFQKFCDGLRAVQKKHGANTLNCTLRDVGTDEESALPYARKDSLAFVLYYNQDIDAEGIDAQKALTRDLVELALDCGGTFYLPYQRHYTKQQLKKAYPEVDQFFAKKRELDPDEVFTNTWYQTYAEPEGVGEVASGDPEPDPARGQGTS
jgi:FAD/FMN-containing dehydrogenase